jgi:hypothetical protein
MLDPIYRLKFMQIYSEAIAQNYSGCEARDLAELSINNKLFHQPTQNLSPNGPLHYVDPLPDSSRLDPSIQTL